MSANVYVNTVPVDRKHDVTITLSNISDAELALLTDLFGKTTLGVYAELAYRCDLLSIDYIGAWR